MSYELVYSAEFFKQLKKLERGTQERIILTLERCRIKPYSHVKKLVGCLYYRFRVGDYIIIIDIQNNELKIYVIEVGHRKNIYN